MQKENSELKNALYKKAVGFSTEEITEEYQEKISATNINYS